MSNIFMRVEEITGDVRTHEYNRWIKLDGMRFGVSRAIVTKVGSTTDRMLSRPTFSEVEIIKKLDKSSNAWFELASVGKVLKEVEIHVCTTDKQLIPYAKFQFSDVMVSDHTSVSEIETFMETLRLNYAKVLRTYIPRDKANRALSPDALGYDLHTGQII